MYLSYPLLGHLADVYLTRYRALKYGLVILTGSMLYITVCTLIDTIAIDVFNTLAPLTLVIGGGGIGLTIIGLGLFEANAIQFGLDQLLEAPTPKLIAFIHWYYWAQRVGQLIIVYLITTVVTVATKLGNTVKLHVYYLLMTILLALITITISGALVLYSVSKKHFIFKEQVLTLSKLPTKCSSTLGSTRSLSVAVPSPTGRRIFHAVLTWERTSMEDHSPMRRWRTLRHSYASYHSSCVCLDTI